MAHTAGLFRLPIGNRIAKSPSCNEILPRLYLGDIGIALKKEEITRLGITDMISVEVKPLQADELAPSVKRYLYINVMDHSKQDILSHFGTSNEFIETALKVPSNRVYVHCVAGISRSATLVIAYVMKTRSMSFSEAFEMVAQKRRCIDPNEGFVKQLVLYHKMKYTIDIANLEYRRMVLDALVFEFRLLSLSYYQINSKVSTTGQPGAPSIIHMPNHGQKSLASKKDIGLLFDQYYNKLSLQQVSQHPQVYKQNSAFKCNKCRTIVFYSISVIENKLNEQHMDQSAPIGSHSSSSTSQLRFERLRLHSYKNSQSKDCPFIFIEPQPWMSKNILERDGNIECYYCKRKLGKFDWTSGESCSCPKHNSHMNLNLFKIMRKKVD